MISGSADVRAYPDEVGGAEIPEQSAQRADLRAEESRSDPPTPPR